MSTEVQGLHNLIAVRGARTRIKRVGRGNGSGMGKTCGRGMKGQKARKSGGVRPGFEGGQIPLAIRLPKRGFSNYLFKKTYTPINIGRLAERFKDGDTVNVAALLECGLLSKASDRVKILGEGDVGMKLNLEVHKVSASARTKIEAAGGTVSTLEPTEKVKRVKYKKRSERGEA
ncbi:MAG: 50S ribosomal protein L15 [Deltaproteobacteria bacterium]|nr:50S ribosomal protein L15 [Deltaproteobacteria bacterium]